MTARIHSVNGVVLCLFSLERQDATALRSIGDYAHALSHHREFVQGAEFEHDEDIDGQVAGVKRTHNGKIVTKTVSCGKEGCSSCPHGPYKYRVYRDGEDVKTEYLGVAEDVPKS